MGDAYVKGNTYYALKHYAKHISRGHQRFEVTNSTGTNANLRASGYINPAGNQAHPHRCQHRRHGRCNLAPSARTAGRLRHRIPHEAVRHQRHPITNTGSVNLAANLPISKNSITTYVIDLAETLNPYDPELLRVDGIQHHGNQVSLAIPSQPGHDFILWKSTTLAPGSWQQVTNAVFTESDGQLILTDPNPGTTRAFYRVQRDTAP